MDLFSPAIDPSQMHANFRRLLDPDSQPDRMVLSEWATGFIDRDGKFVREFQTSFNPCFWELYVFACCKELQFNVNFGYPRPDFVIDNFLSEFCIEAVIASNAMGETAEWERDLNAPFNAEEVLDTAVIRLSNAIKSKHEKYLNDYQKLPQVIGRPFVLAVGPFEQPHFWAHNDHAIRQVLYGYDRKDSNGNHIFRKEIKKPSGATIELGVFTSSRVEEISAIVFSNTATMSKVHALQRAFVETTFFSALRYNHHGSEPFLQNADKAHYQESLLDGLYVFHNPKALHPLGSKCFGCDDICQGTLLGDDPVPKYACKHGHLIQRSSVRIRARPD